VLTVRTAVSAVVLTVLTAISAVVLCWQFVLWFCVLYLGSWCSFVIVYSLNFVAICVPHDILCAARYIVCRTIYCVPHDILCAARYVVCRTICCVPHDMLCAARYIVCHTIYCVPECCGAERRLPAKSWDKAARTPKRARALFVLKWTRVVFSWISIV